MRGQAAELVLLDDDAVDEEDEEDVDEEDEEDEDDDPEELSEEEDEELLSDDESLSLFAAGFAELPPEPLDEERLSFR